MKVPGPLASKHAETLERGERRTLGGATCCENGSLELFAEI
jgi:hypothetical protein